MVHVATVLVNIGSDERHLPNVDFEEFIFLDENDNEIDIGVASQPDEFMIRDLEEHVLNRAKQYLASKNVTYDEIRLND